MKMYRVILSLWCASALLPGYVLSWHGNCKWIVDLVHGSQRSDWTQVASVSEQQMEQGNEPNVTSLEHIIQMPLFHFSEEPYGLLVKVDCPDMARQRASSFAMLSGAHPSVTIHYLPMSDEELSLNAMELQLGAALIDAHAESSCESEVCDATWYVPLPLDGSSFRIEVQTRSDGLGPVVQPYSMTVRVQGLATALTHIDPHVDNMLLTEARNNTWVLSDNENCVTSRGTRDLFLIGGGAHVAILLGPHRDILALSDDFASLELHRVWPMLGYLGAQVCACPSVPSPITITLMDRILIANQYGLFELLGEFTQLSTSGPVSPGWTRILAECVQRIAPPAVSVGAPSRHVHVVTGCEANGRQLLHAQLLPRSGLRLEFTALQHQVNATSCAQLQRREDIVDCQAVDVLVTGLRRLVILAKVHYQDDSIAYLILSAPVGNISAEPELLSVVSPRDFSNISLWRLHSPPRPTAHLYLYGSHILHSVDSGAHWYILHLPPDTHGHVVLMTSSAAGHIAVLTSQQQVLACLTSCDHLLRVYPSFAWSRYMESSGEILEHLEQGEAIILSASFTSQHQFLLILSGVDDPQPVYKLQVLLDAILTHISAAQRMRQAVIASLSSDRDMALLDSCPYSSATMLVPNRINSTKTQAVWLSPPMLSQRLPFHSDVSLYVFSSLLGSIRNHERIVSTRVYDDEYVNAVTSWKDAANQLQNVNLYLEKNLLLPHGIHLDLRDIKRVTDDGNWPLGLPPLIYLDRRENYIFTVLLTLLDFQETESEVYDLGGLQVSCAVSHPEFVRARMHTQAFPVNNTVSFQVTLENKGVIADQSGPGMDLQPVAVNLVAWAPGDFHCPQQSEVTLMLGCPPNLRILYDWKAALSRLEQPDLLQTPVDCFFPDPGLPCLYYGNGFYPYFKAVDEATSWRFQGNYTLRLVGGSSNGVDDIRLFDQQEVYDYNNKDRVNPTLIWGPISENLYFYDGWPVFNHLHNGLSWFCQPMSPCANIMPRFPATPEFYFLVEFSNKDVDAHSTNCDLTMRFFIRVHGLHMDALKMAVTLVLVSIAVLTGIVIVYFVCHTRQGRVLTEYRQWLARVRNRRHALKQVNPAGDSETKQLDAMKQLEEWRRQNLESLMGIQVAEEEDTEHATEGSSDSSRGLSDPDVDARDEVERREEDLQPSSNNQNQPSRQEIMDTTNAQKGSGTRQPQEIQTKAETVADKQLPKTKAKTATEIQVPKTKPGMVTDTQVPKTKAETVTETQVPKTKAETLTEIQVPKTKLAAEVTGLKEQEKETKADIEKGTQPPEAVTKTGTRTREINVKPEAAVTKPTEDSTNRGGEANKPWTMSPTSEHTPVDTVRLTVPVRPTTTPVDTVRLTVPVRPTTTPVDTVRLTVPVRPTTTPVDTVRLTVPVRPTTTPVRPLLAAIQAPRLASLTDTTPRQSVPTSATESARMARSLYGTTPRPVAQPRPTPASRVRQVVPATAQNTVPSRQKSLDPSDGPSPV